MDIRKLQRVIVDGLEDVKAHDIRVYNTEHLSSEFERVIVASGTSNRQTKALAASVRDAVKSRGLPLLSVEGEANGEWIIVDCGAAVAHIMQPAIRQYYNLEEIWGGKPVHMKLDGGLPVVAKKASKTASKTAVAPRPEATRISVTRMAATEPAARKRGAGKPGAGKPAATKAAKNATTNATKKVAKKVAKKAKRPAPRVPASRKTVAPRRKG